MLWPGEDTYEVVSESSEWCDLFHFSASPTRYFPTERGFVQTATPQPYNNAHGTSR